MSPMSKPQTLQSTSSAMNTLVTTTTKTTNTNTLNDHQFSTNMMLLGDLELAQRKVTELALQLREVRQINQRLMEEKMELETKLRHYEEKEEEKQQESQKERMIVKQQSGNDENDQHKKDVCQETKTEDDGYDEYDADDNDDDSCEEPTPSKLIRYVLDSRGYHQSVERHTSNNSKAIKGGGPRCQSLPDFAGPSDSNQRPLRRRQGVTSSSGLLYSKGNATERNLLREQEHKCFLEIGTMKNEAFHFDQKDAASKTTSRKKEENIFSSIITSALLMDP